MDVQYYWWAMGLGGCSIMKKLVPFSPNKVTGLVNWYDANLGLTLAAEPAAITAPTDIANCGLWLDAAQGITETDGKVSAWADQSGNSRDAAQGTAGSRPVLTANVIGVLPGILFTSADSNCLSIATGLDILQNVPGATGFAVIKQVTTGTQYDCKVSINGGYWNSRFALQAINFGTYVTGRQLDGDTCESSNAAIPLHR